MALPRYLTLTPTGQHKLSNDFINSSTGATDADKPIATNAAGELDASFLPVGVGAETLDFVAGVQISSNQFVNIYYDGVSQYLLQKANSNYSDRWAHGFIRQGVAIGETAVVYFSGVIDDFTGLVPNQPIFLDNLGRVTQYSDIVTDAASDTVQEVGWALTPNAIFVAIRTPILLA